MDIRRITDEDKNWFFTFHNEWPQIWETCNWYTWTLCHIEIEDDRYLGGLEFRVILFGLGFTFRWNHTVTEKMAEINQMVQEIKDGTADVVPFDPTVK